jgi:rare lipoprotein A
MDDGPGDNPPADLASLPDAVPRFEPLNPRTARPYVVFGRQYTPMTELRSTTERGMASWYGRKFHGQRTSNGEIYDMYAMTAAHPTAPIPSYARVTHLGNGRTVVVRINDRGPFLNNRIIDLSYAAAFKLGYVQAGSAMVQVELIGNPEEFPRAAGVTTAQAPAAPAPAEPLLAVAAEPAPRLVLESVVEPVTGQQFLQLGAFASRDNAASAQQRLARQLDALGFTLQIRQQDGLWRVLAGPWQRREEAAAANERIRATTDLRPVIRAQPAAQ